MTKNRYRLFAAFGLAALSTICFGLLIWALVEGAVVVGNPGTGSMKMTGVGTDYLPNVVYTREDNPGVYWKAIGFLGFFGVLFTVLAVLEHRSYRIYRDSRKGKTQSHDLLAKIDHACTLYPECRETLLRAKAAVVDLNDAAVESTLDRLLKKAMRNPDRELALKEIKELAKALNLFGKF